MSHNYNKIEAGVTLKSQMKNPLFIVFALNGTGFVIGTLNRRKNID